MIGGPADGMRPVCYGSKVGAAKAAYTREAKERAKAGDYAKEKAECYAKEAAGRRGDHTEEAAAKKGTAVVADRLPLEPCAELAVKQN